MMTDSNQTNHGDHFVIYRNIISPFCELRINIVLQVNYTSKNKQELTEKETVFVVTISGEQAEKELDGGGQKISTSSYRINKYKGMLCKTCLMSLTLLFVIDENC